MFFQNDEKPDGYVLNNCVTIDNDVGPVAGVTPFFGGSQIDGFREALSETEKLFEDVVR